jgi:GxxExxY protein
MKKEELTHQIVGCAYQVYGKPGLGFLEIGYQRALLIELESNKLKAEPENSIVFRSRRVMQSLITISWYILGLPRPIGLGPSVS